MNPFAQWLYLIPNTEKANSNFTTRSTLINEGDNVAFVYNSGSKAQNCTVSVLCYIESYLLHFIRSLSKLIREEQVVFGQISDEEWEIIRPSKQERKTKFLQMIKVLDVFPRVVVIVSCGGFLLHPFARLPSHRRMSATSAPSGRSSRPKRGVTYIGPTF